MTASSSRSSNDGSHGHGHGARAPSRLTSLLYAACIVVAVALVIVPNSSKTNLFVAPVGKPRVATAAEQRAILIAVVEHQQITERSPTFDANGSQRRLALENATVSICGKPPQSQERCSELTPEWYEDPGNSPDRSIHLIDRNLSETLVDALRRFNVRQQPLDTRSVPGIVPVDRERVTAILSMQEDPPVFYCGIPPAFYRAYPQANGILRISRPVVSARGDHALVYVQTTYRNSGQDGRMELFALQRGQWKFVGVIGYVQTIFG